MVRLEDIHAGTRMSGLLPSGVATVESIRWIGQQALKVFFRGDGDQLGERLLYRDDEPSLDVVEAGRPWSFDGDGELLRLVSEAYRINLAWLFDPYVAITTSLVEPLPHQIAAVYDELLPRQPMRFLLADDPGAGKTIMVGLFVKELKLRGDLRRCLMVSEARAKVTADYLGARTRSLLGARASGPPRCGDEMRALGARASGAHSEAARGEVRTRSLLGARASGPHDAAGHRDVRAGGPRTQARTHKGWNSRGYHPHLDSTASSRASPFVSTTRSPASCSTAPIDLSWLRHSAERFRLAIVLVESGEVDGDVARDRIYVQGFDFGQPGFAQTSASFDLATLLQHGGRPA